MSKPRYPWWSYAKSMVRRYPERVNENEKRAVQAAIDETQLLPAGKTRMDVVEKVLIRKSHSLDGAALACYVSSSTARLYHGDFIRSVGKHFKCESLFPPS